MLAGTQASQQAATAQAQARVTIATPPIPPPLIGNEGFGVYPNVPSH
jgi:hypothetical protein